MIEPNRHHYVLFTYKNALGNPVSGAAASLTAYVSQGGSALTPSVNPINELNATICPGVYRLVLDSTETDQGYVYWVVKDTSGVIVTTGHEQIAYNTQYGLFETPIEPADIAARNAFLNTLADFVLRRKLCNAENAVGPDTMTVLSLLGMGLMNTNGQKVMGPDVNGDYFIPVRSCQNGAAVIASIPVTISNGKVIGLEPCSDDNDCRCS